MDKISFIATYREEHSNKEQKVKFNLTLIKDGTTTVIYGQMEDDYYGKTSVSGCSILSPEDTYNEVTGIKIAFKNLLRSAPLWEEESKQVYAYFRKLLYFLPAGDIKIERVVNLQSVSV